MRNQTFYGAAGSNGFVICRSYDKVKQCQKYLGHYFQCKKFRKLDDAENWVIVIYNHIIGVNLATVNDFRDFGTITFSRDLRSRCKGLHLMTPVITIQR